MSVYEQGDKREPDKGEPKKNAFEEFEEEEKKREEEEAKLAEEAGGEPPPPAEPEPDPVDDWGSLGSTYQKIENRKYKGMLRQSQSDESNIPNFRSPKGAWWGLGWVDGLKGWKDE